MLWIQRLVTKAWRGKPRAQGRERGGTLLLTPWGLTTTLGLSFLLLFEVNLCCFLLAKFPLLFQSESEVTQSCLTLCDPTDSSLRDSSIHGIFQARVLEWVAISFCRGSARLRDQTWVSHIVGRCFYHLSHEGSPLSAEFQRIARKDKKALLSEQCKEIEENNRI